LATLRTGEVPATAGKLWGREKAIATKGLTQMREAFDRLMLGARRIREEIGGSRTGEFNRNYTTDDRGVAKLDVGRGKSVEVSGQDGRCELVTWRALL
jgi:hypothetical protein